MIWSGRFRTRIWGCRRRWTISGNCADGILLFLMPYRPGQEGVLQVGNGGTMTFNVWKIGGEDMIPIFTSSARVEEALQAAGKWEEKNGVGEMLGKELLHLISMLPGPCKVVINPGCASGSRTMDTEMVASILDGSALELPTPGELALNGLVISLPARLPARLKEPLAKFFSGCPGSEGGVVVLRGGAGQTV